MAHDPLRLTLAKDGTTKALFSDNSILLLNSSGSSFLYLTANSDDRVVQLSEYAVSRLKPLLTAALEFRNMHMDTPFFCKCLLSCGGQDHFQLGYRLRTVRWPLNCQQAEEKHLLQRLGPKHWSLKAEDSVVTAVLQLQIQRIAFSYPLLISEDAAQNTYTYKWQSSVFSLYEYPVRWQPAVALLLDAARHDNTQNSIVGTSSSCWNAKSSPVTSLRDTQLPFSTDRFAGVGINGLLVDPWWLEPTESLMPTTVPVTLDWKREATYQYVSDFQEVQAWSHSEQSEVKTIQGGTYFIYSSNENPDERFFSAETIPDYLWTSSGKTGHSLKAVVLHAIKFRQGVVRALMSLSDRAMPAAHSTDPGCTANPTPGALQQPLQSRCTSMCADIVEQQCVHGLGRFTAFADGRVKASFDDRTLLHLDCTRCFASFILQDGTRAEVSVMRPGALEEYVRAAHEFADWAFGDRQARTQVLKQQAEIEAQLQRSRRLAAICELATTGTSKSAIDSC